MLGKLRINIKETDPNYSTALAVKSLLGASDAELSAKTRALGYLATYQDNLKSLKEYHPELTIPDFSSPSFGPNFLTDDSAQKTLHDLLVLLNSVSLHEYFPYIEYGSEDGDSDFGYEEIDDSHLSDFYVESHLSDWDRCVETFNTQYKTIFSLPNLKELVYITSDSVHTSFQCPNTLDSNNYSQIRVITTVFTSSKKPKCGVCF